MKPVSRSSRKRQPQSRILFLALLLPTAALSEESNTPQNPRPEVVEADMRAIRLLMQEVDPDEEGSPNASTQPKPQDEALSQPIKNLTEPHESAAPVSAFSSASQMNSLQIAQSEATPQNPDPEVAEAPATEDKKALTPESQVFQSDSPARLEEEIWKSTAAIFGVLLLIALGAIHLLKRRAAGEAPGAPATKPLQLISTLPVGPKRQILLIRVRDQEVAVSSTEAGISVLSPQLSLQSTLDTNTRGITGSRGVVQEVQPLTLTSSPRETASRIPLRARSSTPDPTLETKVQGEARSEILRKAVETIEQRRTSEATNRPQATTEGAAAAQGRAPVSAQPPRQDPGQAITQPSRKAKARSNEAVQSARQTSSLPPLKRLLTSQYGRSAAAQGNWSGKSEPSEGQRKSLRQSAPARSSSPATTKDQHPSQSDNVAQLIREKLKQMKSIN